MSALWLTNEMAQFLVSNKHSCQFCSLIASNLKKNTFLFLFGTNFLKLLTSFWATLGKQYFFPSPWRIQNTFKDFIFKLQKGGVGGLQSLPAVSEGTRRGASSAWAGIHSDTVILDLLCQRLVWSHHTRYSRSSNGRRLASSWQIPSDWATL